MPVDSRVATGTSEWVMVTGCDQGVNCAQSLSQRTQPNGVHNQPTSILAPANFKRQHAAMTYVLFGCEFVLWE
jgi:hypothetical protein